jgi:metallo-beta-lactamase family protein
LCYCFFISSVSADLSVTPYGAASTISGSCFLLETGNLKILIDCSLFMTDESNSAASAEFNNLQIQQELIKAKASFLTHAHLDHGGRILF